jgi:hypothetical protein
MEQLGRQMGTWQTDSQMDRWTNRLPASRVATNRMVVIIRTEMGRIELVLSGMHNRTIQPLFNSRGTQDAPGASDAKTSNEICLSTRLGLPRGRRHSRMNSYEICLATPAEMWYRCSLYYRCTPPACRWRWPALSDCTVQKQPRWDGHTDGQTYGQRLSAQSYPTRDTRAGKEQ